VEHIKGASFGLALDLLTNMDSAEKVCQGQTL
jgi:hypothetical protein